MKKFLFIILAFSNILLHSENFAWINSTQGLKLRTSPDLNSKTIMIIPCAEKVQVLIVDKTKKVLINGFEDYWFNIKYQNTSGWAFGAYISDTKILSENGFNDQIEVITGQINSEKDALRDFFRQKLSGVVHYKYEILNDLPSKVQFFVEIVRFDDKYYEEELSYDFSKLKNDYKKMLSDFNESLKNNRIKSGSRFFTYLEKDLDIEGSGKSKYISYDGLYQYNFSKSLILFKKRSAIIATITFYYDDTKLRNSLVYSGKNGKYIFKDEGLRYNKILEALFIKVQSMTNIY
jgi:hypothetical protein